MPVSLAQIEAVYRSRGADFFRFALAQTDDPESARDAVQDGFARAIRARRSYRGTGPLEAWLARCVINAARDARSHARRPDAFATSVEAEPVDAEGAAVRRAVRELPRRQREALYLRFYLDLDYAVIADVLGIEVGTVSATLHAARVALARRLEEVAR